MKWTIDCGPMPAYIRVETSGEATPEGFAAMWNDILASEFWRPGLTVLMDKRKLNPLKDPDALTTACIEYFAKNAARFGNTCISALSSYPENFKYARQFQYGIKLRGCDVVIQLFSTEKQALEWLDHFRTLGNDQRSKATASHRS